MTTLGLTCSFGRSGTVPPPLLSHVTSWSSHVEVLRAGKEWLVVMGWGEVSLSRCHLSERSLAAPQLHILCGQNTRACAPCPAGVPPTPSCPLTAPKVKKERDRGLQTADSSVERSQRDPRASRGMHCGSLFLSQQWGFQGLVGMETTEDRNS